MRKALIILAQKGYQDIEYAGTRKGLVDAGYTVIVASTEVGSCFGKLGGEEQAEVTLREANVGEFEKVAFIGGPGAAELVENSDVHRIARDTVAAGKVLGAICIAPTILARAGVLKGKKATVWDSGGVQADLLREAGAQFTGEAVTVDGKIVTGNGPRAAEEFGKKFAAM